ncbi:MAG: hypothetical protein ACYCTB_01825 [bacterium]
MKGLRVNSIKTRIETILPFTEEVIESSLRVNSIKTRIETRVSGRRQKKDINK